MPWKLIPNVQAKKLYDNTRLPYNKRPRSNGDAGYDVYSAETKVIQDGEIYTIGTGIALAIPDGYYGRITGRSGLTKDGLIVQDGTVDPSYRGEIMVTVHNVSGKAFYIEKGMRIAQLIFTPFATVGGFIISEELDDTDRGNQGFCSSGLKD